MSGKFKLRHVSTNVLSSSAFWMVNKRLVEFLGGDYVSAAMLAELVARRHYFEQRGQLDRDGGFFAITSDVEQALCIGKKARLAATKRLKAAGLIAVVEKLTTTASVGIQSLNYYYVADDKLMELLSLPLEGASQNGPAAGPKRALKEEVREQEVKSSMSLSMSKSSGEFRTRESSLASSCSDILAAYPSNQTDLVTGRLEDMQVCLQELKECTLTRKDVLKMRDYLASKWTPIPAVLMASEPGKRETWLKMIDRDIKLAIKEIFPTKRQQAAVEAEKLAELREAKAVEKSKDRYATLAG